MTFNLIKNYCHNNYDKNIENVSINTNEENNINLNIKSKFEQLIFKINNINNFNFTKENTYKNNEKNINDFNNAENNLKKFSNVLNSNKHLNKNLYTYFCSLCGFSVFTVNSNINILNIRDQDNTLILPKSMIFLNNLMKKHKEIALKNSENQIELHYRYKCENCNNQIAYESKSINNKTCIYIIENSTVSDPIKCLIFKNLFYDNSYIQQEIKKKKNILLNHSKKLDNKIYM